MATSKMKKTANETSTTEKSGFEARDDLKRLVFYIIIVNFGQSSNIIKLLKLTIVPLNSFKLVKGQQQRKLEAFSASKIIVKKSFIL